MRRRYGLALTALSLAVALVPAEAQAQATGVPCKPVRAAGYSATHIFVDFMPCGPARAKLRRWLPREQFPRKQNGWYCYRLSEVVRGCSYSGKRDANRSFTFWLRGASQAQAAAPIRECGDLGHRGIYNVTSRMVRCRSARSLARRIFTDPACAEDRFCRFRGFRCTHHNYPIPGGREGDVRCTRSGGRVVRFQYGDGG
jgi:hypothetical protein